MSIRKPFEEKYSELYKDWNIEKDLAAYIIRRYTKKHEDELRSLERNELKLPKYFKDRRTDQEYLYDLIDGWLIEDLICDAWLRTNLQLLNENVVVNQMGTNRDRTFQKIDPGKITTDPDFIFSVSGVKQGVELQMARTARPSQGYDMKESKINRAISQNHLFLWIIIPDNQYFFLDPSKYFKDKEPRSNPLWGGKNVYTIEPTDINLIGLENMKDGINEKYKVLLKL